MKTSFDNFDAQFARHRRIMRWGFRAVIVMRLCVTGGVIYLLAHPETIGGYVGRIVAGFGAAS